jgi:hypothetical protein
MQLFENLNQFEKDLLLKFPAYISLLAANTDGKIDDTEKKVAIDFTHVKTFSSDPLLKDYYIEAEKSFQSTIEKLDKELPKGMKERDEAIKIELKKMEPTLNKLGDKFAAIMHKSMKSFTEHVSRAHNNSLEFFLIPFYIKGLTD